MSPEPEDTEVIPEPDPIVYMLDADELTEEEFKAIEEPAEALGAAQIGSQAGRNAVVKAKSQLGVRESGGANSGIPLERYTRYFWPTSGPQPWCVFFVSWSFRESGTSVPWKNPGLTSSVYEWARANRRLVTTPLAGDMFGIGGSHLGLIAGASATDIVTIEGNYGDAVASRRIRWNGAGLWFARR